MHRTTIEVDDKTLGVLRKVCLREKKTFKELVRELVQRGLEGRQESKDKGCTVSSPLERWVTARGSWHKEINLADRSSYWSLTERALP